MVADVTIYASLKADGQSCSDASECTGGFCNSGVCASSAPTGGGGGGIETPPLTMNPYDGTTYQNDINQLTPAQLAELNQQVSDFVDTFGNTFTNLDLVNLQNSLAQQGITLPFDTIQTQVAQSLPAITTTTGTGGGGDTINNGFPQDSSADSGLVSDTSSIYLDPDKLAVKVTLTNKGQETLKPNYILLSPTSSDEKDGSQYVSLKGQVQDILPGDSQSFYVLLKEIPPLDGTYKSYLRVGIDNFKDLQIPITISTTPNFINQVFGGGILGFFKSIWAALFKPLFYIGGVPIYLGYVSLLTLASVFGVLYASPAMRKNYVSLVLFPIFISVIVTSILAQII